MLLCERRSIPRSVSVASRAGSIRSDGNALSHSGARKSRPTSAGRASARPMPRRVAERSVAGLLPHALGLVEQVAAFARELVETEAELLVELVVVRCAERADSLAVDLRRFEVDRVQVLVGELQPDLLEPFPPVAVGLVRNHDPQHPERDRLAVDRCLELGLDRRDRFLRASGSDCRDSPRRRSARAPSARPRRFCAVSRLVSSG